SKGAFVFLASHITPEHQARCGRLQLQQVHAVHVKSFARAEYGNNDGQANSSFSGGHHHYEEHEDVTIKRLQLGREGDEGEVHAVQHQLDGKKDGNDVALDEKSSNATGKQNPAQDEVVGKRDHLFLPPRQHDGAHDGDQDQDRGDFERQQVIAKEQASHSLRITENLAAVHDLRPADTDLVQSSDAGDHPNANAQTDDQARHAQHRGDPAAVRCPLLDSRVEQHDHENEQHHYRAGINDDLHGGDELSAQQQVDHRERSHHHDQRQRAVDGVFLHKQVNGTAHAHRREDKEENQMQHDVCPPA